MTVLANEPLGSFMVRRSETQPGALALSVRVPKTFHPLGITHYIIVRVEGGHQIKVRQVCHRNNEGPDKTLLLTVHSQLNIINDPEFPSRTGGWCANCLESQYFISSIETHNGFSIFEYFLQLTHAVNSVKILYNFKL